MNDEHFIILETNEISKNFSETSDKFTFHFQIIYLKICTKTGGRASGRWREGRLVGVETGAALRFRGLGGETGPIQPIASPPTATVIKVSSFNKEQVRLESCLMLV